MRGINISRSRVRNIVFLYFVSLKLVKIKCFKAIYTYIHKMGLLTSVKGLLETSTFPQLSYKSFQTFLKPHTTNLKLIKITRAASKVAKLVKRRRKLDRAPEEMEHLRERFLNDLFRVAKFIHNLEWATTSTRTQNSSGKFKDLKKIHLTTSCPKHSSLTFLMKMQSALYTPPAYQTLRPRSSHEQNHHFVLIQ